MEKIQPFGLDGYFQMPDHLTTSIQEALKKVDQQVSDLVKLKLKEKGFGHLIDGIEKRVFPKVAALKDNNWTYYYADDNTDSGCFVVAIEDWNSNFNVSDVDNKVSASLSFNWQDHTPYIPSHHNPLIISPSQ